MFSWGAGVAIPQRRWEPLGPHNTTGCGLLLKVVLHKSTFDIFYIAVNFQFLVICCPEFAKRVKLSNWIQGGNMDMICFWKMASLCPLLDQWSTNKVMLFYPKNGFLEQCSFWRWVIKIEEMFSAHHQWKKSSLIFFGGLSVRDGISGGNQFLINSVKCSTLQTTAVIRAWTGCRIVRQLTMRWRKWILHCIDFHHCVIQNSAWWSYSMTFWYYESFPQSLNHDIFNRSYFVPE